MNSSDSIVFCFDLENNEVRLCTRGLPLGTVPLKPSDHRPDGKFIPDAMFDHRNPYPGELAERLREIVDALPSSTQEPANGGSGKPSRRIVI